MTRNYETRHKKRNTGRGLLAAALLAIATVGLTAGCVGMRGAISFGAGGGAESSKASSRTPSSFDNNSTVQLEAARYSGDLVVRSNKVSIVGRGTGSSEIRGDVQVNGNSCTLQALTVSGDVYLNGNNNTLQNVHVTGRVISKGNNNSW